MPHLSSAQLLYVRILAEVDYIAPALRAELDAQMPGWYRPPTLAELIGALNSSDPHLTIAVTRWNEVMTEREAA